jgi:hypothetical protein
LRSSWLVPSANAWSIGWTRWSNSRSCSFAISTPPWVVKSYCGSTPSRAAVWSFVVSTWLT